LRLLGSGLRTKSSRKMRDPQIVIIDPLAASQLARSVPFYDAALGELGPSRM